MEVPTTRAVARRRRWSQRSRQRRDATREYDGGRSGRRVRRDAGGSGAAAAAASTSEDGGFAGGGAAASSGGAIARRTRANLSFADTALEDLETLLNEPSPNASPVRQANDGTPDGKQGADDDDEWALFLSQIGTGGARGGGRDGARDGITGGGDHGSGSEEEEDPEYNYLADVARIEEGDEEFDDVGIPEAR